MIIDTHAHYGDSRFDEDRDELLSSMQDAGVGLIVEVGAGVQSTEDAIALSERYEFVYAAAGIHPEEAAQIDSEQMDWLNSQQGGGTGYSGDYGAVL